MKKGNAVTFHIITLFPESFSSYTNISILKRAQERGMLSIKLYNPRDFVVGTSKYKVADDRPYGGGPGMVMKAEPILKAVQKALGKKKNVPIYIFSPSGGEFTNVVAEKLTKVKDIVLISGRYEGVDARVKKILKAKELSIGNYTLTGGELPAMVVMDAVVRRIKGVLGKDESVEERRIAGKDTYTRPATIIYKGKKYNVPAVLQSGNHAHINEHRKNQKKP
jgi:tRNA (guanine37-N1)-methyltransferase